MTGMNNKVHLCIEYPYKNNDEPKRASMDNKCASYATKKIIVG